MTRWGVLRNGKGENTQVAAVAFGILLLVGGVGVAAYGTMMIEDLGVLRYVYQDEYNYYQLLQMGGLVVAIVGLVLVIVGAASGEKPSAPRGNQVIPQQPIYPGATNFCPICGRQLAPGAVSCPGCGRKLPSGQPTQQPQYQSPLPTSTPAVGAAFCPYCARPYEGLKTRGDYKYCRFCNSWWK